MRRALIKLLPVLPFIVLGLAAVLALFVFVFSVIKRSDVYREAYTRATNDARVEAHANSAERLDLHLPDERGANRHTN